MNTTRQLKIPAQLSRYADPSTRPLRIDSRAVVVLLEFWWPCNGRGLLLKLVRSGSLIPIRGPVRKWVFETEAVFQWALENGA